MYKGVYIMHWTIDFYESKRDKVPVENWLDKLNKKKRAKIIRTITLLEEFGTKLIEPYCKLIRNKLYELRIKFSSNYYRIIYFLHTERRFILLHGFTKTSKKIPEKEIKIAEKRRQEFLENEWF